jgi:hypothetical protein
MRYAVYVNGYEEYSFADRDDAIRFAKTFAGAVCYVCDHQIDSENQVIWNASDK